MYIVHRSAKRPTRPWHRPDRPARWKENAGPMQPKQLRRLQALWRRWGGSLGLVPEADRRLRHYYIEIITRGRAGKTMDLGEADAALVIEWLRSRVRQAEVAQNYAAGTAGRRGYPEHRKLAPTEAAWSALWGCARSLGMERPALEHFIRKHYGRFGLRGLTDLRTMADLNRVLWGLKALARRRGEAARSSHPAHSGHVDKLAA